MYVYTLINLHLNTMGKMLVQKITTFLHPVTSSASAASEVECEERGGESPLHLQLPRRPSIMIVGLAVHGWMSFHGFAVYWMIKKAPSCTVHSVENLANQ